MDIYHDMLKEVGLQISFGEIVQDSQEKDEKKEIKNVKNEKKYGKYCHYQISCLRNQKKSITSHTHPGKGNFDLPEGFQYNFEQLSSITVRKIHFYSRLNHFKFKLNRLLAYDGHIPEHVHEHLNGQIKKKQWNSKYIYRHIRKHLKKVKWQKYYVLIPSIIHFYTGQNIKVSAKIYSWLLETFKEMEKQFYLLKNETVVLQDRTYFPSYHYIIVQLLDLVGVSLPYIIPGCLTQRKKFSLNYLFNSLLPLKILEEYDDDFKFGKCSGHEESKK